MAVPTALAVSSEESMGYYKGDDYYWYWRGYNFRLQTNRGLLQIPTVNYQKNLYIVCELYNKMLCNIHFLLISIFQYKSAQGYALMRFIYKL